MKSNGRKILFIEIKAPSPQICGTKPTSKHEKHWEPQIDRTRKVPLHSILWSSCLKLKLEAISGKCQLSHRDRKEEVWESTPASESHGEAGHDKSVDSNTQVGETGSIFMNQEFNS